MRIPVGGDNAYFLDLYARYRKDRHAVPVDWALHFDGFEIEDRSASCSHADRAAALLIDAYRRFGHLEAELNPLAPNGYRVPALERARSAAATLANRIVRADLAGGKVRMELRALEQHVRLLYASRVGLEVEHIHDETERHWWYEAVEQAFSAEPNDSMVSCALESVILADEFESFMRVKFPTSKRFGIEGAESSMVFLRTALERAAATKVQNAVIGGMHRGRLAMLAVVLGKSLPALMAEVMGQGSADGDSSMTGDVPYHLGYSGDIGVADTRLRITLLPHPSHLLAVAPVALGLARASRNAGRTPDDGTICFALHTDGAFAGQGLAAEILQLGGLPGYSVGGTVHLVVNNQISFTTLPAEARSSIYCTDAGKTAGVPILHVNGDDPIAVARAAELAIAWRRRFHRDVLVDLVCYRRNGHNELDEPRFTQPRMWSDIDRRPGLRSAFTATMQTSHSDPLRRAEAVGIAFRGRLQAAYGSAANAVSNLAPLQGPQWNSFRGMSEDALLEPVATGVDAARLREIGLAACTIPDDIDPHPKVRRFYDLRATSIREGREINFATAESLAFASLSEEGFTIRLSGQDTVRGTFTQRHLVVHDVSDGRTSMPLARYSNGFEVLNSPLSEYGVLGFEYGFSLFAPDQLTVWEAQFGDFLNGAQVVVDQFLASAEAKWDLLSGLVVMLPHGLEGQGPDHSSGRIERLAQLASGGNIVVAQPSTPANLFHLLRRQMHARWRKPLFALTPKSLLRSKAAVSSLDEMAEGSEFRPIIAEPCRSAERIRRVLLCSGKIFFDLVAERSAAGLDDEVRLVRIEQIYPLHLRDLEAALASYPDAELVWVQEEPANQGAWQHVRTELARGVLGARKLHYVGRPPMAACAVGSAERHAREQTSIHRQAVGVVAGAT